MSAVTVVIGSEVNELVAAHYLARAGQRVVVLEQHRSAADDHAFQRVSGASGCPTSELVERATHLASAGARQAKASPD